MPIIRNPALRTLVFACGALALALGFAGLFLPFLPTTPFVLLAAWCFVRSSDRAHAWLRRQPGLGTALADWERNRAISRRTKVVAIGLIAFSLAMIWLRVRPVEVRIGVTVLLLAVSTFIATRNE